MLSYSRLLKDIIATEKQIREEVMADEISALSIFCAILTWFKGQYIGFSKYEENFEEERVRYLLDKILWAGAEAESGLLTRLLWRLTKTNGVAALPVGVMDIASEIATARKQHIITTDIMLLVALQHLERQALDRINSPYRHQNFDIVEVLADADQHVYDYTLEQIDIVKQLLDLKAKRVKDIRDWRPAKQFVDNQTLRQKLYRIFQVEKKGNTLELTIPDFFADLALPLELTLTCKDEEYYIQDNRTAMKALTRRLPGEARSLMPLVKMLCGGTIIHVSEDGTFSARLHSESYFYRFIQYIILVAHADLIRDHYVSEGEQKLNWADGLPEPADDPSGFLEKLKEEIRIYYSEYDGIYAGMGLFYFPNSTSATYLFRVDDDETVWIRDGFGSYMHEGAIFETLYADHDDLSEYQELIEKICSRFGGVFNGMWVTTSFVNDSDDAFGKAFVNFVQMAVILALVGYRLNPS